jgi:hypothetical protein
MGNSHHFKGNGDDGSGASSRSNSNNNLSSAGKKRAKQQAIKPLTKTLTDKEIEFIANNSSLSRAEIDMWHNKFLVN